MLSLLKQMLQQKHNCSNQGRIQEFLEQELSENLLTFLMSTKFIFFSEIISKNWFAARQFLEKKVKNAVFEHFLLFFKPKK